MALTSNEKTARKYALGALQRAINAQRMINKQRAKANIPAKRREALKQLSKARERQYEYMQDYVEFYAHWRGQWLDIDEEMEKRGLR